MLKIISKFVSFIFLTVFVFPLNTFAQSEPQNDPFVQTFSDLNKTINHRSEKYLFRLFQFRGKYRGGYRYTEINKDGVAVTFRRVQFATQASRGAALDKEELKKIKQKLADFSLSRAAIEIEPKEGESYSAFVFQNKDRFIRLNFLGDLPQEIREVLDRLNIAFKKAEKEYIEQSEAEGRRLLAKYGKWQELPNILIPTGNGWTRLKNSNGILMFLNGFHSPIIEKERVKAPIFYALILYEEGFIVGGAGCCSRGDDPISRYGIKWNFLNDKSKSKKEFIVEHNAIERTLKIKQQKYELQEGNLFVIRLDKNWNAYVEQLNTYIDKTKTNSEILDYFKKNLSDDTLEIR